VFAVTAPSPVNVATPDTAAREVVPVDEEPQAFRVSETVPVNEVSVPPPLIWAVTVTVGEKVEPETTLVGWDEKTKVSMVTLNEELVTELTEVALAVNAQLDAGPTELMPRPENVATPEEAVAVVAPVVEAPQPFRVRVTRPAKEESVPPPGRFAVTITVGEKLVPVLREVGCDEKTRLSKALNAPRSQGTVLVRPSKSVVKVEDRFTPTPIAGLVD